MLEAKIPLLDLLFCLSDTIDLVSPKLANHHMEVAYIARELGKAYGLGAEHQNALMTAGMLHDVGALSLTEKLADLDFKLRKPHHHAELSYLLLKSFPRLTGSALMARFHHVPWNGGEGARFNGHNVPLGSHILHLADRISALKNKKDYILDQSGDIRERIKKESGKMFMPDLVDAFRRLSEKQCFWLDMACPNVELPLSEGAEIPEVRLDLDELLSLTRLFAQIIDFRSKYTATHSAGVAAVGKTLARLAGFPETECRLMELAGYLHDLGKLAVPSEIIEKPGKLTKEEFNVVFSHPFYTRRALHRIKDLGTVTLWASLHHERLNGGGYPYHLPAGELSRGARIMAVADVFTAILEERPYQRDIGVDTAMGIIRKLADGSALDPEIAGLLRDNQDKVNSVRVGAQEAATAEYRDFYLSGNLGPAEDCPSVAPGCPPR